MRPMARFSCCPSYLRANRTNSSRWRLEEGLSRTGEKTKIERETPQRGATTIGALTHRRSAGNFARSADRDVTDVGARHLVAHFARHRRQLIGRNSKRGGARRRDGDPAVPQHEQCWQHGSVRGSATVSYRCVVLFTSCHHR